MAKAQSAKRAASTNRSAASKGRTSAGKKLPPALTARADALAAQARARVLREAQIALEEARAAISESERHYYELGRALLVLRKPGYSEALGYAGGFMELCERALDLSKASVGRLVSAVEALTQEEFARFKRTRVNALLALASATAADDTREILAGGTIRLWEGGPTINVAKATTPALAAAAAEVRARIAQERGKRPRGRSATPEERARAKEGSDAVRAAGSKATVRVRATKPGQPAVFDVEGLTRVELDLALAALTRRRR